eukprot:TRINITY_DN11271_c0_g1_i1.p1 TRINITY_DN11271_c0_g1~~TRINITY_DN11271_c0_g1_i1.p1  ORF type:complete len:354 (-),score=31.82 TRINITY_DN11271_c0_g1_i1:148-1119(-)
MGAWSRTFFVATTINYLLLGFFSLFPIISVATDPATSVSIYMLSRTLLLLTLIAFQASHSYAGLVLDNIYEIYAMMMTQAVVTLVLVLATWFQSHSPTTFEYGLFAYAIVLQLFFFALAYPLHQEHRWSFYKKVGADPFFRSVFRSYLRFTVVLKVDFMVMLLNLVCMSSIPLRAEWLIALFVIGLCVAVGFFSLGYVGFRGENTAFGVPFWMLSPLNPTLVGLGVYSLLTTVDWSSLSLSDESSTYSLLYLITAAFLLVTRVALLVLSSIAYRNWGQGLRGFNGVRRQPDDLRPYSSSGESDVSDTEISVRGSLYSSNYSSI